MMKEITVTIDRFEDELAVFRLEGNETAWAKRDLPEGIKEGDLVVFRIFDSKEAKIWRDKSAKELLNELLNGDEKS